MPEDATAIVDSPDLGTVDTSSTDVSTDASASVDAGTDTQTDQVDSGDTPQDGETGHLRGAELYRAVKEKLRNGEKLSPQEQRSIRNAIHIAGKADQATGGDLGAFERERAAYEQLRSSDMEGYTPEQVVEAVRDKIQFWDDFDSKFEQGDPSIIETMVEQNPASFQALTLAAMDKFAEVNNEAFSTYVAQSAANFLRSADIPLHLSLAKRFLPESSQDVGTQAVIDAFKAIEAAFTGIQNMASRKIDVKKPEATATTQQNGQTPEAQQMDVTRREWNLEAGPKNAEIRDSEMAKIASNRKLTLTDKEKQEVKDAVRDEYNARLAADRRYGEAMQSYIRAGNRKAYNDTSLSKAKLLLPAIVARHTNAVLDKRPKGNGSAKPAPQAGAKASPQAQVKTDATGTSWLNGSPASLGLQVDYGRTTQRMLLNNEAYIKGKKELHRWKARVA